MLRSGLSLHYQPIVSAATGRVVAAEALLRENCTGTAPMRLFSAAAHAGECVELDREVLGEACSQLQRWRGLGMHVPVHVNVSAATAASVVAVPFARWLAELAGVRAALTVEITETTRIRGFGAIACFGDACRDAGIEVAIDDFGCGYATLQLLQRFRADVAKVDRRFVAAILDDRWTQTIVRHMIALAHDLGMRVIAEGIETDEQAAWMSGAGCEELQGFRIARPMPNADFVSWVLRRNGELRP